MRIHDQLCRCEACKPPLTPAERSDIAWTVWGWALAIALGLAFWGTMVVVLWPDTGTEVNP